jgi:hypothetical protein
VHVGDADVHEGGDGEARRVALLAEHDQRPLRVDAGVVMRAGRVDPPLEHVPVDDERAGDGAVGLALGDRTGVDEHGALVTQRRRRRRLDHADAAARPLEVSVDRAVWEVTHRWST